MIECIIATAGEMTRHSKNASSASAPTYHERQQHASQYGTQYKNLSISELQTIDSCNICNELADDPLICNSGHIYCKQCIYTFLLQQKQAIKTNKNKSQLSIETAQSDSIQLFELGDSFNSSKRHKSNTSDNHHESSYWIPSKTPSTVACAHDTVQNDYAKCPVTQHALKLKELHSVHFTLQHSLQQSYSNMHTSATKFTDRYMCGSCNDVVTISTQMYCILSCGHVICTTCYHIVNNDQRCCVCSNECGNNNIVKIYSGAELLKSKSSIEIKGFVTASIGT